MKCLSFAVRSALCAASLGLACNALARDYDILELPMPAGWSNMFPTAMNDHGHVVGVHSDSLAVMPRGFYYNGSISYEFARPFLDSLPYPGWQVGARPLSINNHNHILFTLEIVDVGGFSYLWDGENFTEVQPDVPGSVGASAINNYNVIVGTYNHVECCWTLTNRGWTYDPATGVTTIIEPPAPFEQSTAFRISDSGYVTGYVSGGPIVATAFLWKDGVMTLFEGVDNDDYLSIGSAVNNHGFGGALTTNSPPMGTPSMSRVHLWSPQDGSIAWAYPHPPFNAISVFGINNNNEIVGTMIGPQQPFHFHNGVMRNLNHHIPQPGNGIVIDLWDAVGISASGQIAAHGNYLGSGDWSNYAFLLTPKPACPPADLNGDCIVNVFDLLMLLSAWGPCAECPPAPGDCPADLTGDCNVNVFDLLALLSSWG